MIGADSKLVSTDEDVLITRTFSASAERLFAAWTDPAQLLRWYAPRGCRIEFKSLDMKLHGSYLSCITIPNGEECWCKGSYLEFDPPRSLVFSMINCDANGETLTAIEAGKDDAWPTETIVTVTFDAISENKTKLTLHQTVSLALATKTGAYPSWLDMLDQLEALTNQ